MVEKYNYFQVNKLDWKGNNSFLTGKDLFEKATFSVHDIVDKLIIRLDTDRQDGKSHIILEGNDLKNNLIAEQGHRKYGKCYVYQPNVSIRKLGIYNIKIDM